MKAMITQQQIKELTQYYLESGLTIVGLNDSQGINISSIIKKKDLLTSLKTSLSTIGLDPQVWDAFSMLLNKTEHIQYLLQHNLSMEEIVLSQQYSAQKAFEKVLLDLKLPQGLQKLAGAYKLIHQTTPTMKDIHITTQLQNAVEPTIIYSSGINNVMREIGTNPWAITKQYKERHYNPEYYECLKKAQSISLIPSVMNGITQNLELLLGINPHSDIYVVGSYIPYNLQAQDLHFFKELIIRYNAYLQHLCKQYKLTYIDTTILGDKYATRKHNFHLNKDGHQELTPIVLQAMYQRKITEPMHAIEVPNNYPQITQNGASGMYHALIQDYHRSLKAAQLEIGYESARQAQIAAEHQREVQVLEKVMDKSSRTY